MSANPTPSDARSAFAAWRDEAPDDLYGSDRHLVSLNRRHLDPERLAAAESGWVEFGKTVAGKVRPLAEHYERSERLPAVRTHDGFGRPVQEVVFDEAYHEAGRLVWASGIVALAGEPGRSFEQATLAHLVSHEGEMGHTCPAVCTIGMIRALRRSADADTAARFLPQLTDRDYDAAWRGAQFLTEVQGGSDVGANVAIAREDVGEWRVSGEKWFCSVADADAFLVTARPEGAPEGTRGLGCFIVPRMVDGAVNGFAIRRLKDKLGTRAMASAEIEFADAVAHPVGAVDAGFKTMVNDMLNASRWLNAIGDAGIMRRAYLEAAGYAGHRHAFGRPVGAFPVVRLQLARIKAARLGVLHSTWRLTGLDEYVDLAVVAGEVPDPTRAALHRFLVNANKLVASVDATSAVREAIEILGGNGAIEDFSVLPRLLRDCVVYEQWEGTHNVLTAQVVRDLGRLGTAGTVIDAVLASLKAIASPDLEPTVTRATAATERAAAGLERCVADAGHGALHGRAEISRTVRLFQVASLLETADLGDTPPGVRDESAAAADLLTRFHLEPGYVPEDDRDLMGIVDRVLGDDV